MKAMIFAAGLGTRLKPLTDTMPKAMVEVAGRPLLEHVILKLKAAGFDEIIVNVHHFADQIIAFLKEKNNFGIRIEISDEREMLLETGGGIKKASWFFDDDKPFLVHNVDILSDIDLLAFYKAHTLTGAIATLLVSERDTSRYLLFDNDKHLRAWTNVKTGEVKSPFQNIDINNYNRYAFSGIHVMSPEVFRYMKTWVGKFSIIDFYLSIANECNIDCWVGKGMRLIDVGKLDSLTEAEGFVSL